VKRIDDVLTTLGALVGVVATAAALTGCGGTKTGGTTGSGGATQGTGGVTATGGTTGTGGTGVTGGATGAGGATAAGGTTGSGGTSATGGSTGAGGAKATGGTTGTGGSARTGGATGTGGGGTGGTGGRTTLLSGTGGGGIDGGAAGSGTGGLTTGGAGGFATGGVGGTATGGVPGMDGGAPDAPSAKCSDVTTQAACDARTDCHSVFVDPGTCGCAGAGCCAHFQSCADGDQANCMGPVACTMAMPFCESPYIVSVRGACYEGCVKQTDCALPACPLDPPANGSACGPVPVSQTCYYEDCAGAGRTVATCSTGASTWQVTTGPCAAIACEDPSASSGLTCPAGMVCIITRSSGGTLMTTSTCVDHTCGTGPITPECVPSLSGTCTETYSAAGAIFRCELVADCGEAGCA
jgi:hypothetical protein